jgi:quercetin dioxygenase-like cupin family protein
MSKAKLSPVVLVLAGIVLAIGSCGEAASKIPGPDAPAPVAEPLARGAFSDQISGTFSIEAGGLARSIEIEDPSEIVIAKVTLAPGASVGWHRHPGPAIGTVTAGTFTFVRASDCKTFVYKKGQSFVDPGHDNVHIGFNASETEEVVVHAVYLEVPKGQMPSIRADAADC